MDLAPFALHHLASYMRKQAFGVLNLKIPVMRS